MNRIKNAFNGTKAFIAFITMGDPGLGVTEELVPKMAEAGADIIELGIPFSDPVAEGVVIQRASARALSAGFTTDKLFESVKRIRKKTDVPLALMTYVNPVFVYGADRFLKNCADSGIDGIIIPDMPFEERSEIAGECKKYGVDLIPLIAPTSRERIQTIAREAEGFVYCVSSLGVTGVRSEITTDIGKMVRQVKEVRDIPCAVGFGISTPEQAGSISGDCDGVIVGSAIVRIAEKYGEASVPPIVEYVKEMKAALR